MDGLVLRHPQTAAIIFNPNTVTTHIRAAFTTTGAAGSMNIPDLARGGGFIVQAVPAGQGTDFGASVFTINGTTVSWTSASRPMRVVVATRSNTASGGERNFIGYAARRPNGVVQVSSVDRTLQLSNYGALTLTATGSITSLPMVYGDLTVSGVNPVLAWRATNGRAVSIHRVSVGSGQFTFHFACQNNGEVGIQWWTFDVSSQGIKLDTDVALVLREPSDTTVTFDSRTYVLNLIDGGAGGRLVPSADQELAAIQATFGHRAHIYETDAAPGDTPPGPGWKYLVSESYHSAAAFFSDGSVEYGLRRYEFWTGWDTAPVQDSYSGSTAHAFANVAGLPRAPMPNVDTIAVNVSPASSKVTITSSSPTTTVTPGVTATATGGSGQGYSYSWHLYPGSDGGVEANTSTTGRVFSTKVVNQQPGTVRIGRWWCRVQDSAGRVGWSEPIPFEHVVEAYDVTPDPLTWPDQSWTTTSPSVSGAYSSHGPILTGVNRPIQMRMRITSLTSNLSSGSYYVVDTRTTPHTILSAEVPIALNQDVTFTAAPGATLTVKLNAATLEGRRSAAGLIQVRNLETDTLIGAFNISVTVDSNDVYYPTVVDPNPVDWPNVSGSTTAMSLTTSSASRTIAGITQPITLRLGLSGVSLTGSPLNGPGQSTVQVWINGSSPTGTGGIFNNQSVTFPVSNGDSLSFRHVLNASSALTTATAAYTATVTNVTTNQVLDTFTVSQSANVADYTPDAMTFPNASWSTANESTAGAYGAVGPTVSGVNRPTRLRYTVSGASSNLTTGSWFVTSIVGGVHTNLTSNTSMTNGSSAVVTVENGTNLTFKMNGTTNDGIRSASGTITVTNVETGATLGTFTYNLVVDNDNSSDVTPDPMSWPSQSWTTANPSTSGAYLSVGPAVSGLGGPISVKFTLSGVTSNLTTGSWFVTSIVGGTHTNLTSAANIANNASATFQVTNGTNLTFKMSGTTNSGRRAATGTVTVTNATTGASLGSFPFSLTVDSGDSHNVLSVSLNTTTAWGHAPGQPGTWVTAEAAGQVVATVSGGNGTVSLVWEKLSGISTGWSVTGTTSPTFAYYGQANFNQTATFRLRATDSVRTVYSPTVTVNLTGGILN